MYLFHQTHQALNLWLRGGKYSVQLLLGVMLLHKSFDIHLPLPTTNYKPAGEHVILETAESKIDLTPHPGASDRFVVILFNQGVQPPVCKVYSQELIHASCEYTFKHLSTASVPLKGSVPILALRNLRQFSLRLLDLLLGPSKILELTRKVGIIGSQVKVPVAAVRYQDCL